MSEARIPSEHLYAVDKVTATHGKHYPCSVTTHEAYLEARIIAGFVVEHFPNLKSFIDVGCAGGGLVLALLERGLVGFGIDAHRDSVLPLGAPVLLRDATIDLGISSYADAVFCYDMPEHVPEDAAPGLIDNLCKLAPLVFFSAAEPAYAGAHGHQNCKPPEWWLQFFREHNFELWSENDKWRSELKNRIETHPTTQDRPTPGESYLWWTWTGGSMVLRNT